MALSVSTMRADFLLVAADRRDNQGWTEADIDRLGAEIRIATQANDPEAIAAWALYLATEAEALRALAQQCREVEARIRAERAAEREKAKA